MWIFNLQCGPPGGGREILVRVVKGASLVNGSIVWEKRSVFACSKAQKNDTFKKPNKINAFY